MQRLVPRAVWQSVLGLVVLMLAPLAAAAQTSQSAVTNEFKAETPSPASTSNVKIDGAVGYSWLHSSTLNGGDSLPLGFFATVDGALSDSLALVGDFSFGRKGYDLPNGGSLSVSFFTLMAGGKVMAKQGQYTPYGQVLVGFAHSSTGGLPTGDISSTDLAVAPGAGVDVDLNQNYGLRVGLNFRLVHTGGDFEKQVQLIVGIVFKPS